MKCRSIARKILMWDKPEILLLSIHQLIKCLSNLYTDVISGRGLYFYLVSISDHP